MKFAEPRFQGERDQPTEDVRACTTEMLQAFKKTFLPSSELFGQTWEN